MRSSFLDEMGVPKTDLRKKYHCPICGTKITSRNFGMSSTSLKGDGWTEVEVYCNECFLKPEALQI